MRRLGTSIRMMTGAALVLTAVFALSGCRTPATEGAAPAEGAFDPKDISGLWARNMDFLALPEECENCGDRGYSFDWPEFTPEGQKVFESYMPSRGRLKDSKDANDHPEEHIGRRRQVLPALSNDPAWSCNPQGLVRNILYQPAPFEIIVTPDRVLQLFEWTWDVREVWMDGRKAPAPGAYIPRWNGYSVGRWEGDTFIVDTTGFDSRAWLDHHGYPMSDQGVLQERYKRVSPEYLELSMTYTDPVYYTKPWVSETKRFKYIAKEKMQIEGWSGLLEEKCIPMDEVDQFNKRARNPAAGVE
jgi:hypothetical protein